MAAPRPKAAGRRQVSDEYMDLVRRFPLRPILSDAELAQANEVIDSLLDREELSDDADAYLDVLSDLVERYEDRAHPMPDISDADMLRHLIESRDVTQAKVAAETGIAEPTISNVLCGKRKLTRDHIAALARYFKVSPAVFLGG